MATQNYPIFKITADFPTLGQKTGEFHIKKVTAVAGIRTGYLVDNQFDNLSGPAGDLAGQGSRKGVTVDTGGGQHFNEVRFAIASGADGQWGYSSDASVLDEGTATGGDRLQKAQVFNRYLLHSSPDSVTPATLEYGEYAPSGVMPEGALDVYLESPEFTIDRERSQVAEGTVRFISTINLADNPVTSLVRQG